MAPHVCVPARIPDSGRIGKPAPRSALGDFPRRMRLRSEGTVQFEAAGGACMTCHSTPAGSHRKVTLLPQGCIFGSVGAFTPYFVARSSELMRVHHASRSATSIWIIRFSAHAFT